MNKEIRKYLVIILIIILVGLGIYRYTDFSTSISIPNLIPQPQSEQEEEEELVFPEKWQVVEENTEDVVVKLSKETDYQIATNLVLTKTEDVKYEDQKEYTDRLISGTKNALPSLNYGQDETEENDYFVRKLSGSYWNDSDRVEIKQAIYLGESTVYVITASYPHGQVDQELQAEVDQIFNDIAEEYIEN